MEEKNMGLSTFAKVSIYLGVLLAYIGIWCIFGYALSKGLYTDVNYGVFVSLGIMAFAYSVIRSWIKAKEEEERARRMVNLLMKFIDIAREKP